MKRRIVVIGLDGATFSLLQPLIEKGLLPTLKRLMDNGTCGLLKSSVPPVTVPAWKCYSTGKNPGKLGATTFLIVNEAQRKVYPVNSTSFYGPEIWDIVGRSNLRSIVLNMPLTYPAKKINGIIVSGVDTPRSSCFSYPKEIMKELSENIGNYQPWHDLRRNLLTRDPLRSIKKTIQSRFSAMEYLCKSKEWDFFHGTIFLCDVIQHYFWTDMNFLSEIWTIIDQGIGKLIQCLGDMSITNLFLISDHGFGRAEGIFYLDRWMIEEGYLKLKGPFRKLFIHAKNKIDSLIHSMIKFFFPSGCDSNNKIFFTIFNKMLSLSTKLLGKELHDYWDWEKSKTFALMDGISAQIYINKNQICTTGELEDLKKEIQSKLTKMVDIPLTVFDKSEVYKGDHLKHCPDLIVISKNQKYLIQDTARVRPQAAGIFSINQGKCLRWTGTHRENGIFVACGPDIKKNNTIHEANILDLAPTILHILEVPIPRDMDGKVLKDIFIPRSTLARKEINYTEIGAENGHKEYVFSKNEKKEIKDRLKELGYL